MRHARSQGDAGSPAKRPCRTVVWNEDNLAQCEANKDAKMKIDEPETPWASPPRELFNDEDVPGGGGGAGAVCLHTVAAQLAASSADGARSEWDEPHTEAAEQREQGAPCTRHESKPTDADAELRQRLFEARRKAFQGSYRSVARHGTAEAQDEGDDEGPSHVGSAAKPV